MLYYAHSTDGEPEDPLVKATCFKSHNHYKWELELELTPGSSKVPKTQLYSSWGQAAAFSSFHNQQGIYTLGTQKSLPIDSFKEADSEGLWKGSMGIRSQTPCWKEDAGYSNKGPWDRRMKQLKKNKPTNTPSPQKRPSFILHKTTLTTWKDFYFIFSILDPIISKWNHFG